MLTQKIGCKDLIKWDPDNIGVAPTEGLPVKYIYHHGKDKEGHDPGFPFACEKCCLQVINLLKALGLETDARGISDNCHTASTSTARSTNCDSADTSTWTPRLNSTDVLVLFELCKDKDFYKNTKFCKTLK